MGQRILKILSGKAFIVKAPVTLTFNPVTSKSIGIIWYSWLPPCKIWRLWVKGFLSYWADKLFYVKVSVTLTFDLVTSKSIGVIWYSWLTSMQIWRLWVKGFLSYWANKLFLSRPLWPWPLTQWPPDGRTTRQMDSEGIIKILEDKGKSIILFVFLLSHIHVQVWIKSLITNKGKLSFTIK